MTTVHTRLLPCPFCGAPAKEFGWRNHYGCSDEQCGANAANLTPEQWNRRPSDKQEITKRIVKDVACGRWVGQTMYWDIGDETISADDFKRWIRQNMPESWDSHQHVVAYHTIAFANRRAAFSEFMKTVDFTASYEASKAHRSDEELVDLGSVSKDTKVTP